MTDIPHAVGIDLGTTYSVVAYLDELGRPQTLVNREGDRLTPSAVFFEGDTAIVGKEALKALGTDAEDVAQCAKRELGKREFFKPLGGRNYPPEALQAWVLDKLRRDAIRQIGRFRQAVVTVPAYFDEVRRKATQDAGYIAGLEVLDIINEPTAAALALGAQQGFLTERGVAHSPQTFLVYDLGGGTFDVTVMEITGNEFVTLATDGDVRLGGHDWDQRLLDFVAEKFTDKHGADPREDPNARGRLWRDCEDAKRTLSARRKAFIACDYLGNAERVEVSRAQFEHMTQDLLERTLFTTRQTLQAAGLSWKQIDRVLLVGGSTRMPAVNEALKALSGLDPDASISADEAVAHGAALHAGLLLANQRGERTRFSIKNVNSHSLGVVASDPKTKLERNTILIPRNTPLPATAQRVFKTQHAGQRSVLVRIVEGESGTPDACVQIGRCSIRDMPKDLPAKCPIEVHFHYEPNGRLKVRVKVAGTDKQLEHELDRPNSLTQPQLDTWRRHISGSSGGNGADAANVADRLEETQWE